MTEKFKPRAKIGQYRILRKLGGGGFAEVWKALDTIEGVNVALKVPHASHVDKALLENFRKEARTTAALDHPNILSIKTAVEIGGTFMIVSPLGIESLEDRLERRLGVDKALSYAEQLLEALAFAHKNRLIHCDIKPENILLFEGDRIRLADFGIAKVAMRTLKAHGTGTLGYAAPEQAYGRPSFRSDVFGVGIVVYRMLTGVLPEWPFHWPLAGHARLKEVASPDLMVFLKRTLEVDAKKRYPDAVRALAAFKKIRKGALAHVTRRRTKRKTATSRTPTNWQHVRLGQFVKRFGKELQLSLECSGCKGPMSHEMRHCPWCGKEHAKVRGETGFTSACPRCQRGMKADWRYCPWCWGAAVGPTSNRELSDRRYSARCANKSCDRKDLMPFMRYCPWCHDKITRVWPLPGSRSRCERCEWGVSREFWSICPWCATPVTPR